MGFEQAHQQQDSLMEFYHNPNINHYFSGKISNIKLVLKRSLKKKKAKSRKGIENKPLLYIHVLHASWTLSAILGPFVIKKEHSTQDCLETSREYNHRCGVNSV